MCYSREEYRMVQEARRKQQERERRNAGKQETARQPAEKDRELVKA